MTQMRFTTEELLRRVHASLALLADLHRMAAAGDEGLTQNATVGAAIVASEAARDIEHILSTISPTVMNAEAVVRRPRLRR